MQNSTLRQAFLGFIGISTAAFGTSEAARADIVSAQNSALSVSSGASNPLAPIAAEPMVLPGDVPPDLIRKDAVKITAYKEELKRLFPQANEFRELDFFPIEKGGTSFTGLVTRLLGVGLDREHEGLRTRRYYYLALEKGTPVGVAHASSFPTGSGLIDVWTFYSIGGTVKEVQVQGLNSGLRKEIVEAGYLKQFEGKSTEDFEVILGRRGRIKSRGAIFRSLRYPGGQQARATFEKIFRSLRFNAAFMDVAFFITQHPDLADKATEEFPDEISVVKGRPLSGPEAFVSDKAAGSPIDGTPTSANP